MGIRSGAARRLFPLLVGPILGLLLAVGSVAPTAPVARALTLPSYRIDASLDVDGGRLAGHQIVRLRNALGRPLDSVVFHVMPATLGAFSLEASAVDGWARDAQLNGSVLEIPFVAPLGAGATAEIDLRYTVRLPRVAGRISATGQAITLGRWFPILSVHHGDWDRRQYVDVGDAFFTAVADYDVTLTTSRPLVVAATGQAVERDGTRWRFVAGGIRDFALTASPDYAVRSVAVADAGATISGYARSPQTAQLFARVGATFVRWYGDRFGPYPYPSLAIAEASIPASFGGLEYPALIMLPPQGDLSSTAAGGALEILIAHEVAHQWFYNWVGNDQIADPWLDEAFATYLPLLHYADARPDLYPSVLERTISGTADGAVDSTVYDFPNDGPYFATVYRKGARFLQALRERLGDQVFFQLLRDHVATHRDRVATPRAFLDLAQAATTTNLNPLIAQSFSYAAFHYPAPQTWTLEAPAIPWQGSVYLFVGAEFPVTRVELWLDDRLLADGPENAVTVDLTGAESGEYVLLARVWNHEGVVFERTRRVSIQG